MINYGIGGGGNTRKGLSITTLARVIVILKPFKYIYSMKRNLSALFAIFSLLILTTVAFAQNASKTSRQLLDEGIALHDDEKYDEAIEKYKAALQIDPTYQTANYEIANTLYAQDKNDEAIVYLNKVISAGKTEMPDAYNLLGNIYDDKKEIPKALELYKKGIALDPSYQRLHFNLAVCYFRQDDKYKEAQDEVEIALKLEPGHKSSHLLYGNIAFFQKKATPGMLGYASFLLKDATSEKAETALTRLRTLMADGKELPDTYAVFESTLKSKIEIATANSVASGYNSLYQHFFADYFRQLVRSPIFESFARYISLQAFKEENLAWFKANPTKADELDKWSNETKRGF